MYRAENERGLNRAWASGVCMSEGGGEREFALWSV